MNSQPPVNANKYPSFLRRRSSAPASSMEKPNLSPTNTPLYYFQGRYSFSLPKHAIHHPIRKFDANLHHQESRAKLIDDMLRESRERQFNQRRNLDIMTTDDTPTVLPYYEESIPFGSQSITDQNPIRFYSSTRLVDPTTGLLSFANTTASNPNLNTLQEQIFIPSYPSSQSAVENSGPNNMWTQYR